VSDCCTRPAPWCCYCLSLVRSPGRIFDRSLLIKRNWNASTGPRRRSKLAPEATSHARLSELIQQFGTELLIARDKRPTPREVEMLDRYAEALNMYRDSLTLWRSSIDSGSRYVGSADVDRVKDKYELPAE
jgi:hypothetical protein